MIVKTRLAEVHDELVQQFQDVRMRGQGRSSFIYATNKGRAVEISEDNGGFWLEFWEKSDDEEAGPVKEVTVDNADQAVQEARSWLA